MSAIESRVLRRYAIPFQSGPSIAFKPMVHELLDDLLIFEQVILDSTAHVEIAALVDHFGYASVVELLRSGALRIKATDPSIVAMGPDFATGPFAQRAAMSFEFVIVGLHRRDVRCTAERVRDACRIGSSGFRRLRNAIEAASFRFRSSNIGTQFCDFRPKTSREIRFSFSALSPWRSKKI